VTTDTDGRELVVAESQRVLRSRERAAVHSTRYRGLSYRQRNGKERTYLGYIPGRGRVRLNSTTERAAVDEYNDLRGQVAKGAKVAPSSVRFKDVAEEWLEQKNGRLKEWTLRNYRASLDNEILPRFGHRKLRDISVDDIAKFVRDLDAKGKSTSTIQNHLKPMSQTFRYAMRRGLISVNPVGLMTPDDRPEKRVQVKAYEWSDDEITSVFTTAEQLAKGARARADYTSLLRTAVFTGLRLGELLGLQWQDVDFEDRVIIVQRQWTKAHEFSTPKTTAGIRRVPLTADMVALLKTEKEAAFSEGRAKPEDLVFPSRAGSPMMHRSVQRAFESIRDRAGLPEHLTFHDLRHAFASLAAHAGVETRMLSEAMGHSHATVTARYTHLYNRERAEENFRRALGSISL
jgi:integrase